MFGRFIDLARAAGPVIFELQNGPARQFIVHTKGQRPLIGDEQQPPLLR
jgi:hypothetical protein